LSSGNAQKEVLLGYFGKEHNLSSAALLPGQPNLEEKKTHFRGQGYAKGRPGQPWINAISGWLWEASPSQCNQSPLPWQRHIKLSGKSFAFPTYPFSVLHLPLCLSLADVEAVQLKMLGSKLTSAQVQAQSSSCLTLISN